VCGAICSARVLIGGGADSEEICTGDPGNDTPELSTGESVMGSCGTIGGWECSGLAITESVAASKTVADRTGLVDVGSLAGPEAGP
jgi:hypothetical protein